MPEPRPTPERPNVERTVVTAECSLCARPTTATLVRIGNRPPRIEAPEGWGWVSVTGWYCPEHLPTWLRRVPEGTEGD
jgi:hypothetical protein